MCISLSLYIYIYIHIFKAEAEAPEEVKEEDKAPTKDRGHTERPHPRKSYEIDLR